MSAIDYLIPLIILQICLYQKTFKEVSRTDIKIPLYEILVPSTSVCSLLHGMLPTSEDTMTDGIESDPEDELYLVVTITADSANETSKKNSRTLVIYNTRQQKVTYFSIE